MSAPEYLTIKDFAKAANVSTQRIYQRLAKDLQEYCKTENGKKYLSSEGLKLFGKEDLQADLSNNMQGITNTLQETIEALREQLNVKDAQLSEKDKQIEQLTAALQAAQEQQKALTTLLNHQQALHAGDIQRQLTAQERTSESVSETVEQETEPPKRSFFKSFADFFRRKGE
jgi:chromosome segregation ATPase